MRTIFAEYNPGRNSIDVYTSADYMLRIDCWEAEKNLRTTPGSDCALNTLAIDEPLEYARLYCNKHNRKTNYNRFPGYHQCLCTKHFFEFFRCQTD